MRRTGLDRRDLQPRYRWDDRPQQLFDVLRPGDFVPESARRGQSRAYRPRCSGLRCRRAGNYGEHREPSGGAGESVRRPGRTGKGRDVRRHRRSRGYSTGSERTRRRARASSTTSVRRSAQIPPPLRGHEYPSGNLDLRATIARAMALPSGDKAPSAGRPLEEALAAGHQLKTTTNVKASTSAARVTVSRMLLIVLATTISTTLYFSVLSAGPRHVLSRRRGIQADQQVDMLTKAK